MAKKPRSQRRKKKGGSVMDGLKGDRSTDDRDDDSPPVMEETLSDSHTIADTMSTAWEDEQDDIVMDDLLLASPGASKNGFGKDDSTAAIRQSKLVDALSVMEELPSEKRSAKREGSLRRVFRALTHYAAGDAGRETVAAYEVHVRSACAYSVRAGSPAEQYAACRVLEATSVLLGGDQDEFCEAILEPLKRIVMSKHRATMVRIAALRALAMADFVGGADDSSTNYLLDFFEQVAAEEYRGETVPSSLRAAALDCWALLSTTTSDFSLAGQDDMSMGRGLALLELLNSCLQSTDVDLRSAAGECVALIHEARLNLGVNRDEADNATQRRFRRGSWDGSEWEVLMDEVRQRIAELSVESARHMSKKAKKEQRATFREFHATIVEDESPEEVVNFRGGKISIDKWRGVIQLNFLRHSLQGGLQIQLLTNETLQAIFGTSESWLSKSKGLSQVEKRLMLSKTSEASKAADQDMIRRRRVKNNVKNYFLTADGEDI